MIVSDAIEAWFDSPGDILAILSVVALLFAGILFLIDARVGSIRGSMDDLKEGFHDMRAANDSTHDDIKKMLADHISSPAHNRRWNDAKD